MSNVSYHASVVASCEVSYTTSHSHDEVIHGLNSMKHREVAQMFRPNIFVVKVSSGYELYENIGTELYPVLDLISYFTDQQPYALINASLSAALPTGDL